MPSDSSTSTPSTSSPSSSNTYSSHEAAAAARAGASFLPWPVDQTYTTPRYSPVPGRAPVSPNDMNMNSCNYYASRDAAADAQAGACFVAWPGDEAYASSYAPMLDYEYGSSSSSGSSSAKGGNNTAAGKGHKDKGHGHGKVKVKKVSRAK